jgi:hypothetical protein
MSEQMPARIYIRTPLFGGLEFVRADIAERMAEALERSLSWLTSYPGDGALGTYEQARSALSAFRSATQDTEARHE